MAQQQRRLSAVQEHLVPSTTSSPAARRALDVAVNDMLCTTVRFESAIQHTAGARVVAPRHSPAAASDLAEVNPAISGDCGHRIMVSYGEGLMELNEKNCIVWHYQDPDIELVHDVWKLDNNNILFSHRFGVREVNVSQQIVWDFTVPRERGQQEINEVNLFNTCPTAVQHVERLHFLVPPEPMMGEGGGVGWGF